MILRDKIRFFIILQGFEREAAEREFVFVEIGVKNMTFTDVEAVFTDETEGWIIGIVRHKGFADDFQIFI